MSHNNCLYTNCGQQFPCLHDLIMHVEDTHIDFDPKVMEQMETAPSIPMSYMLRYTLEDATYHTVAIKQEPLEIKQEFEIKQEIHIKQEPDYSGYYDNPCPNIPIKQEFEDIIPKSNTKRFSCPVVGCKKQYKHENGMQQHFMNCHDKNGNVIKPKKEFVCHCGRDYKTLKGYENHLKSVHDESLTTTPPKETRIKIEPGYPQPVPRISNNRILSNMFPPEAYNRVIIKQEDNKYPYNMNSRGMRANEEYNTAYPNPFYKDRMFGVVKKEVFYR